MTKKQKKLIKFFEDFLREFEWIHSATFVIDFRYQNIKLVSINGCLSDTVARSRIPNLYKTNKGEKDTEQIQSFFVNSGMKLGEYDDFCEKKDKFLRSYEMSFYPKCGISPTVEYSRTK